MTIQNMDVKLDLVKTTESDLANYSKIADGTIYFAVDSKNLYADLDGKRHCFNSIWFKDSFAELAALPKIAEVLYWDISTNNVYRYIDGTLTKVSSSKAATAMSLERADSLESIVDPSENSVYAIPATDNFDGDEYDLYVSFNGDWIQITTDRTAIEKVANQRIKDTLVDLEVELAIIRDSLKAGELDESQFYNEVASFYRDVYTKSQVYTMEEVDVKLDKVVLDTTNKDNRTQPCVTGTIHSVDGMIKLQNDISTYTHTTLETDTISINTRGLKLNETGDVIYFEILLFGGNMVPPVYNFNIVTWVDGEPDKYYNNTIVGFRSVDNGKTWVGYYCGGWN